MKKVYPQLPSSSLPPVYSTHTNQPMTSATDDTPVPTPEIVDKDVAKPSNSKAKFKQRRERSTSPADDVDSDVDFESLDVHPDEEVQRAVDGEFEPRSVFPDPSSPSSPSLYITQRKGGSGFSGSVKLVDGGWVTNYEYGRLQNMAKNKSLMRSMELPDAAKALVGTKKPSHALQRARVLLAALRRSTVSNPAGPRVQAAGKVLVR